MTFINVSIFLILLQICSSSESNLLKSTCKTCQKRNFIQNVEACACQNQQFCNETTGNCSDCGHCFHLWEEKFEVEKDNVQNGLNILIRKYENISQVMEAMLTIISTKTKQQENRLDELVNYSNNNDKDILNIAVTIDSLKKTLEEIENNLKTTTLPTDLNTILMILRDFGNKIKGLEKEFQEINIENVNKKGLTPLIEKQREVLNAADILNTNVWWFEDITNYLSLALAVEHNMDVLDPLIHKFDRDAYVGNMKSSIQWIDKAFANLINILYIHKTGSLDDTQIKMRASGIRSASNTTRMKLENLLKDQENFEQILKQLEREAGFYRKIQNLQNRLNAINGKIRNLNTYLKVWKELKILNEELGIYKKELEKFKEKMKSIKKNEQKMNTLLVEELELTHEFQKIQKFKSVDELRNETMEAIRENEIFGCQIISHCGQNITC